MAPLLSTMIKIYIIKYRIIIGKNYCNGFTAEGALVVTQIRLSFTFQSAWGSPKISCQYQQYTRFASLFQPPL